MKVRCDVQRINKTTVKMVKPQLNLDRKDDLKKPDGTPVNVFVTVSVVLLLMLSSK